MLGGRPARGGAASQVFAPIWRRVTGCVGPERARSELGDSGQRLGGPQVESSERPGDTELPPPVTPRTRQARPEAAVPGARGLVTAPQRARGAPVREVQGSPRSPGRRAGPCREGRARGWKASCPSWTKARMWRLRSRALPPTPPYLARGIGLQHLGAGGAGPGVGCPARPAPARSPGRVCMGSPRGACHVPGGSGEWRRPSVPCCPLRPARAREPCRAQAPGGGSVRCGREAGQVAHEPGP